ncbi:MAG: RNA-binding protein [Nanoarchaeota archaeon]|nr:RNA-binding protein [Nanoarchaeota archaeon]
MKLYIGNLPWKVDDSGLKEMFASYDADEANVITDKFSGRSKGFGFVTIADDETANKAISEMNDKEIEGRAIKVSEAKPMVPRDNAPRAESRESNEAPIADSDAIENDQSDDFE